MTGNATKLSTGRSSCCRPDPTRCINRSTATYAKYAVPEYWIIDPDAFTLEQYVYRDDRRFELHNVYEGEDPVASDKLP